MIFVLCDPVGHFESWCMMSENEFEAINGQIDDMGNMLTTGRQVVISIVSAEDSMHQSRGHLQFYSIVFV